MKTYPRIIAILILPVAVYTGYSTAELFQNSGEFLPAQESPALDYFVYAHSFSEVKQTKFLLQGLSEQLLNELRTERAHQFLPIVNDPLSAPAKTRTVSNSIIPKLKQTIQEFEGTEQQFTFVEELLHLLYKASQYQDWIDVYLHTLYQHPTHKLLGQLAIQAVAIAQLVDREWEVFKSFHFIQTIPLEFSGKQQIQRVFQVTFQGPITSERELHNSRINCANDNE